MALVASYTASAPTSAGPRRRRVQLQRVFPYGVTYQNGTFRSFFCSEKPHSATHWADNYATVGRIRTMSTQVTEGRYKSAVKTKPGRARPTTSLVRRQPPPEQHGGGGGDRDGAAPGRDRFALGSHRVCQTFCRFHRFGITKPAFLGSHTVRKTFLVSLLCLCQVHIKFGHQLRFFLGKSLSWNLV